MPYFHALRCHKTLATHVFVGMGAASFWRGAWYVLDDHLFPDSPSKSALSSWVLGVAGLACSQGLTARAERMARLQVPAQMWALRTARVGALYTVAVSCVLVWRGTWLGWDVLYEVLHPHNNNNSSRPRDDKTSSSSSSSVDDVDVVATTSADDYAFSSSTSATTALLLSSPVASTTTTTAATTATTLLSTEDDDDVVNNNNNNNTINRNIKSTDRGHATSSGLISHLLAVTALLTTGLFASVLAPPAACSVIRDLAVKAGQAPPTGPAQLVASRLFGGSGSSSAVRTPARAFLSTKSSSSSSTRISYYNPYVNRRS